MSDSVLYIDDLKSYSGEIWTCRICHEEEFQGLEAPCACSETVKFAHRDCIQRWCNAKRSTTCEICLQKFEPAYALPPEKTRLNDTTVTIRISLGDSPMGAEQEDEEEILETDSAECVSVADRCAAYCRSVALVVTALFLIRHAYTVLVGGVGGYPFSLLTVLMMKISGIVFPMYILLRIVTALHDTVWLRSQNSETDL